MATMARRRRKIPMTRKTVIKTRTSRKPALVKLIKSVTRRTQETKQGGFYALGISLFHNQTNYINNFLSTIQGVQAPSYFSNGVMNGQRIGDKIQALGLKFQLYHECGDTRPNSVVKYFVFYYNSQVTPADATFWQGSTISGGNLLRMIDAPNKDNITILHSGLIQHQPNYYTGVTGFSTRNCATYRTFYVKINRNITYLDDSSTVPKFRDVGFAIVNCDQNGTIQTDRVGYYNLSAQLFFKDA